jgi:hypothetical protein
MTSVVSPTDVSISINPCLCGCEMCTRHDWQCVEGVAQRNLGRTTSEQWRLGATIDRWVLLQCGFDESIMKGFLLWLFGNFWVCFSGVFEDHWCIPVAAICSPATARGGCIQDAKRHVDLG